MQPTYTPPIPVIGNHPAGCSCTTCVGARKRLLASPFVQGLISDLSVLHEQFYKATEKPIPAPELEARVLTLTDELATAKEDSRVLTNALNESRKINQEREKQIAEEKRLHRLSKMSDANARGTLQQIRTELGGDPDEPALTKVQKLLRECIERGVACEHNAAEVVRLAESLRLAEQGRQEALKSRDLFRGDLTAANKKLSDVEASLDKAQSSEKQAHELLSSLTAEVEAQGSARRLAEGRYVALLRRRSIEWGILCFAFLGMVTIAALLALVNGGAK